MEGDSKIINVDDRLGCVISDDDTNRSGLR